MQPGKGIFAVFDLKIELYSLDKGQKFIRLYGISRTQGGISFLNKSMIMEA